MFKFLRSADLAVDLGTSKIAVYVRGEGLVVEEPACIAFKGSPSRQATSSPSGTKPRRCAARRLKAPSGKSPIDNGVISDCWAAGLLLETLLAKHRIRTRVGRRRFLVGTLFGANTMERRSFEQVARLAGAGHVALVQEPYAAAVGAGLQIAEARASMVVDVGGGATEALVLSLKNVVRGGSVRIGGNAMNEAIQQYLHRHVGLDVGLQEAERLKEAVAGPLNPETLLVTRGIDTRLRRPRAATVTAEAMRTALTLPLVAIAGMVKDVVEGLPEELAADLISTGITLTGGGASTLALQTLIEATTQVPVHAHAARHRAMIDGCGRMLDYFDYIA